MANRLSVRSFRRILVLCAAVAAGCCAPGFTTPGLSRRNVGLIASGLILGTSESAKAAAVSQADKDRLARGYKDLVYMMKNFNTVTRKCEKNQENIQRALQSGQASPDGCIANPLVVRKYLGQTSIKADLFNTKDLLVNMELAGMVPSKNEDEYGDLVEDFETYKRQSDEWAYSSSWAEANPGGGRDRTEDYLLRSKGLADKATKTLGRIVEILGLSENLYAWCGTQKFVGRGYQFFLHDCYFRPGTPDFVESKCWSRWDRLILFIRANLHAWQTSCGKVEKESWLKVLLLIACCLMCFFPWKHHWKLVFPA